jgi:hypothetical protein
MRENVVNLFLAIKAGRGKRVAERAMSVALFSEAVRAGSLNMKRIKGGEEEYICFTLTDFKS